MKDKLIVIAGPTAVGKTNISVLLAKKLNGEIISADSMQVYKGMDIGTAKISPEEMKGIRHHLIDIMDPDEEFNITVFQKKAKEALRDINKRGKLPIVVGGTGFYIQSLLYDIEFKEEDSLLGEKIRKELEEEYDARGADFMHEKLKKLDKEAAGLIHKNNKKRLIRAIEYALLNNKKISEHNEEQRKKESVYDCKLFVLNMDRKKLYERINYRVDLMFEKGLLEEFEELLKKGCNKSMVSMQGIGYKEIFEYKENRLSLEELKEKIKQDTRHFAKRQITWFKREKEAIWMDKDLYLSEDELLRDMILKTDFIKN